MKNTLKNELTLREKIELIAEQKRNWVKFPTTFIAKDQKEIHNKITPEIKDLMAMNWEIRVGETDY